MRNQVLFWLVVMIILTLLFSTSLGDILLSFYFVSFLLPIIIGTSYFFNEYLVPQFLLKRRRLKFGLYFFYMLIVSIYLEMLVMIFAFAILADYQIENLGRIVSDIYVMAVILYLVVFSDGFVKIIQKLRSNQDKLFKLEDQIKKDQQKVIQVKVDRRNVQLELDSITYIESLSDYITIHTIDNSYITKEKISAIEEKLPSIFIRIHRSFIVNRKHISSFGKESVNVNEQSFTIGRKYKKGVESALENVHSL